MKYVHNHGSNVRGPLLSLKYSENKRRQNFRCAVIVSRKVHGAAVVRNRIRRRIYEVVRQVSPQLGSYDLVFVAFNDQLASISAAKLQKTGNRWLGGAHLLNNPDKQPNQRDIIKHKET